MSFYLVKTNSDIITDGERENIRYQDGVQIEYGNINLAGDTEAVNVAYLRPFSGLTRGVASWRFMYEAYGHVSFTETNEESCSIYARGLNNGISQPRSVSYFVIGRWK